MMTIERSISNVSSHTQKELSLYPSHLIIPTYSDIDNDNDNNNIYYGDNLFPYNYHILSSSSCSCSIHHANTDTHTELSIRLNDNEEETSLYPSYLIQSVYNTQSNYNNNMSRYITEEGEEEQCIFPFDLLLLNDDNNRDNNDEHDLFVDDNGLYYNEVSHSHKNNINAYHFNNDQFNNNNDNNEESLWPSYLFSITINDHENGESLCELLYQDESIRNHSSGNDVIDYFLNDARLKESKHNTNNIIMQQDVEEEEHPLWPGYLVSVMNEQTPSSEMLYFEYELFFASNHFFPNCEHMEIPYFDEIEMELIQSLKE